MVAASLLSAPEATPVRASPLPDRTSRNWVAIGVGLAPSPYGLDGNGSPVGDVTFGRNLHHRTSLVTSITRLEFLGYVSARFAVVSTGVRAHLSKQHSKEGGPYLGLGPVICYGRFAERGASGSRILPGIEASVGAFIPLSESLAFDWVASHIVTTDAGGFTPRPITGETKRDGLNRGTVRIRLVLRR